MARTRAYAKRGGQALRVPLDDAVLAARTQGVDGRGGSVSVRLAKAVDLKQAGTDARVVTEEKNDTPRKMSLRTAAGLLGIPSVPLRAFLEFEGILRAGDCRAARVSLNLRIDRVHVGRTTLSGTREG